MRRPKSKSAGQALVETILMLPIIITIVLNAINFGYFFLMALNITSSSRTSGLYSIMADSTPAAIQIPKAGPVATIDTVSHLAYQDLTGSVSSPSTAAGVRVCSSSVGLQGAGTTTQRTQCTTFGSITFPTSPAPFPDPDPELNASNTIPAFLLNRVDVAYQFSPIIPFTPFSILVMANPNCVSAGGTVTCTFYRHSVMRVMG